MTNLLDGGPKLIPFNSDNNHLEKDNYRDFSENVILNIFSK